MGSSMFSRYPCARGCSGATPLSCVVCRHGNTGHGCCAAGARVQGAQGVLHVQQVPLRTEGASGAADTPMQLEGAGWLLHRCERRAPWGLLGKLTRRMLVGSSVFSKYSCAVVITSWGVKLEATQWGLHDACCCCTVCCKRCKLEPALDSRGCQGPCPLQTESLGPACGRAP